MYNYTNFNIIQNLRNKINNGNGECVKEVTTRQKSIKQLNASNGSLTQRENLVPGGSISWLLHNYVY